MKKFILKGNYTEGKHLLVKYILRKFWNRGKTYKRPPSFYYRVALMRMKGKSLTDVGRIFNITSQTVVGHERKIQYAVNHFLAIVERNPIKLEK